MKKCIFCEIVKGAIPSHKLFETEKSICFLDINPLNRGHFLVIPKEHAQFMNQLSDDSLADLLPVAKKVVNALGPAAYNVLQNNGRAAHQMVDHVHFHVIPCDEKGGLGINWSNFSPSQEELLQVKDEIMAKLRKL